MFESKTWRVRTGIALAVITGCLAATLNGALAATETFTPVEIATSAPLA
jgi:hypothetical protein